MKLSAGWLIEQSGWKGRKLGKVGVYENHALILVNYGASSGLEIKHLAEAVAQSVEDRFGYTWKLK